MTDRPAPPRDWDAASYDRISGPQAQWGLALLDRLVLRGDETVRERFVTAVVRRCGDPVELDYVRLNIAARRPLI